MLQMVRKIAYTSDYGGEYTKDEFSDVFSLFVTLIEEAKTSGPGKNNCKGLITFCVEPGRRMFREGKYIYGVDCDSLDDAIKARSYAEETLHLPCVSVESSPEHFWIFFDKIGTFDQVIDWASNTPGVDKGWIDSCQREKKIALRAFPKDTLYPRLPLCSLTNPTLVRWYGELRQYYASDYFNALRMELLRRKAILTLDNCVNHDGNFALVAGRQK
jgi:hypothetical protein